jgi:hypothetical protein
LILLKEIGESGKLWNLNEFNTWDNLYIKGANR